MKNTEAGRTDGTAERPQWGDNVASTTSVATVGIPLVTQSPTRSSKRTGSEKGGDVGGRKKRGRHRRKHNKLQPAASPSGVSSVSSSNEELASASNVATPQGTNSPAIEAKEEKTARHREAQDGAAVSKAAAASVLPGRPAEPRPAASTISKTAAGAASKTTAGRPHSSKQERASRVADIYEALATLVPYPEKQPSKPELVNPFTTLTTFLEVRPERSSTDYEVARSAALRKSRQFFVTVLTITLFVVVVMTSAYVVYAKTKSQHEGICLTNDCDQYRRLIEDQLDNDVDPCDDFGAYVCGRWNPREEYRLSRSQLSDMFLSWLYKLPETLKKGASRITAGRKVLAMFRSCMSQTESKIRVMKKFMRDRGIFWPDNPDNRVPPLKVLFDLSFNWNVHLWFTLKMLPAVPNAKPRRIFLRLNDLMMFWKRVIDQIPEESFHHVYEELYNIHADDPSKAVDGDKMSETYNMLTQVFNTIVPSRPRRARTPGLFRLRDAGNQTPFTMGHDMMDMFNAVMRIDPPITMDDLVLVSGMSELAAIWEIIKKAGDNALWLFVLSCAPVANPAAFLLVFHGSEHRAMEELPRFCAGQIEPSYKLLIAAIASVAYFSRDERRHINEHLDGIVKVAIEKTEASSWLDNATKRVAVEKLKSVRTVLWPSEKFLTAKALDDIYRDFPGRAASFIDFWIETRRNQRLLFGSEVAEEELKLGDNTYLPYVEYVQVLNRLSLSLGALAPPLYYREGTKAMLYGGILYRYARALIGAIDNEGVKVNAQGEIVPAWLSGEVRDTFDERTLGCLSGNDSIFPEIPAMEVAYAAFKRQLGEKYIQLSKTLTEEKVFFITSCLATCAVTPADNLFGGRCNKAVMNFAPFAKAFGCAVGSPMNPVKKCSFYD